MGWPELDIPASRVIALEIYCTDKLKSACMRVGKSIEIRTSTGLTPQILCTCRTIHQEATPMLYYANIFQFQLQDSSRLWENNTERKLMLESLCQKLYHNTVESWSAMSSKALIRSDLAVFLRQIGRQNAANLKRLKFLRNEDSPSSFDAKQAGWAIEVVAQLLKCYAPGVRQIKICCVPIPQFEFIGRRIYIHWDDFEYGPFEPTDNDLKPLEDTGLQPALWDLDDENSLHDLSFRPGSVRLEEEKAIYQAISDMVQELTWLNHLRVTGLDEDDQTRRKVEDLQTLVKNRPLGIRQDVVAGISQ